MQVTSSKQSMLSVFLPEAGEDPINIVQVLAIAKLLATTAKGAAKAITDRKLTMFDALVGDNFCQGRGYFILNQAHKTGIRNEAKELLDKSTQVEQIVTTLQKSNLIKTLSFPIHQAFDQKNLHLEISEKMSFLVQAYLLTLTKQVKCMGYNGDMETTNVARLKKLSTGIGENICSKIVVMAQSKLAESSIAYLQKSARKIALTTCAAARFVEAMVNGEHIKNCNGDKSSLKKLSSIAYYNTKTILLRIQEKQACVLVKNKIVDGESPFVVVFRSPVPGAALEILETDEVDQLVREHPVFVIEAFIPKALTKEDFLAQVRIHTLFEMTMAGVAQEPQYAGKIKEAPVADETARDELERYSHKAREIGCHKENKSLFYIDHTYCNTLQAEEEQLQKKLRGRK